MKIWFLTTEFPPFYGGGIGTYMSHAVQMFAAAGHEVTVFVPGEENIEQRQSARIRLIRFRPGHDDLGKAAGSPEPDAHPAFPFNVMSYWPAMSYRFAIEVGKLIAREGPPDLIEVQDYSGIGYYLLQQKLLGQAGLSETLILVHLHTPGFEILALDRFPDYRLPEYWVGRMERFSILAADGRICPSRFLRGKVVETITGGRGELDVDVIPLPFKPLEVQATEPEGDTKTIVYVGRLEPRKGVLPLVACCDSLWREGEDFKLLMVGGDTDYYTRGVTVGEYLRRRYEARFAEGRIEFTGNLPPDQCARQVARAWAVTVPSLYENFPLTCVEAMHAGKVVIASSAGGQAEMVGSSDCGYIFDWSEEGLLERCFKEALRLSPGDIKATGARAQARIREMTAYENILPQRMVVFEKMKRRAAGKKVFPSVNRYDPLPPPAAPPSGPVCEPGLLSVVVPYYNMGRYLGETVRSILSSKYQPLEIVVVDDGSDERESVEKLREIEAAGQGRLRVVRTENRGLASARNTGAENACGEYLALVDADDLVEPDFFTRCAGVLKRYENVSLVYSWVRYFDAAHGCFIANNLEFPYLLAHNMLAAICVLKRADYLAFARNKPQMSYGLEDYEAWISLYEAGRLGVCIPEFLTLYRVRPGSMLRSMNDNQTLFMYDEIVRLHAESYRRYGDQLFRLLNANGASFAWNSPGENRESAERRLRWCEQRLQELGEEAQSLRGQLASLEWARDLSKMGIRTALRGLGYGLKRKTREVFKGKPGC